MLKIEIISDTVCPWCYIGKRRLESALAARRHIVTEVIWRPFRLHPNMTPAGLEQQKYLASKFGSLDRAGQILNNLASVGGAEGINFNFAAITRQPNTLDSHRLIKWAALENKHHGLVETLYRFHFLDGRNLGDHHVLIEAARSVGLQTVGLLERLNSDEDVAYVLQSEQSARTSGVSGVPCFVFNDSYALSGAQAPSVLLQIIDLAHQGALNAEDGLSFPNLNLGQTESEETFSS